MQPATVRANGLSFGVLEDGPPGGPLALCLHGFPDTAHTWRHLLPVLAAAGFHAVAPFLRGYAPTDVPPDGRYQLGALVRDANSLHDALGGDGDAVLVGHDWGALVAYGAVAHQPRRWRRLVAMAVPPLAAVGDHFLGYRQLRRSWYQFFFQTPLAEVAVPRDGYAFLGRLWQEWSPGYDAAGDLPAVTASIGTPERLAAALGYYRALYDPSRHDPDLAAEQQATVAPVPRPTLYLHGEDDGCIGLDAIGDPLAYLGQGSAMAVVASAGHFVHLERHDEVAGRVRAFLGC